MKYFLRALQIMGTVSEWSVQALEDRKVTLAEAVDLAQRICKILGVEAELDVPME